MNGANFGIGAAGCRTGPDPRMLRRARAIARRVHLRRRFRAAGRVLGEEDTLRFEVGLAGAPAAETRNLVVAA